MELVAEWYLLWFQSVTTVSVALFTHVDMGWAFSPFAALAKLENSISSFYYLLKYQDIISNLWLIAEYFDIGYTLKLYWVNVSAPLNSGPHRLLFSVNRVSHIHVMHHPPLSRPISVPNRADYFRSRRMESKIGQIIML